MALSATTVWEVQTGGSDTNGGGFKTGASGTDWTQQTAAQYSVTDAVTNGTTTITSATASFGTDVVGNVLYIAGGTGSIVAARYEIVSRTNSTTIVVDRSTGLSAGTGATLKIGGALQTLATLEASNVAGNKAWIKSGTYTLTSKVTLAITGDATNGSVLWQGYQTTRGDNTGTQPDITSSTSALTLFESGLMAARKFKNIKFSHTGASRGIGFDSTAGPQYPIFFDGCLFDGLATAVKCDNLGASNYGEVNLFGCRIINSTSAGLKATSGLVDSCIISDGSSVGVLVGARGSIIAGQISFVNTIIESNASHGISLGSCDRSPVDVQGCVFHNNTGDGIGSNAGTTGVLEVKNSIFTSNGGYGINVSAQSNRNAVYESNAFKSNTSGSYGTNTTAGTGDITLTVDPFTDAANQDFTLNATAGGGADLKSLALPTTMPFGVTTTNKNIGVAQNAYSAGGSGGLSTYAHA